MFFTQMLCIDCLNPSIAFLDRERATQMAAGSVWRLPRESRLCTAARSPQEIVKRADWKSILACRRFLSHRNEPKGCLTDWSGRYCADEWFDATCRHRC